MEPGEYETLYRVEATHWWYRALHKNILHAFDCFSPRRSSDLIVLDTGCGTGLLLQNMQKRTKAFGVDYSKHAVAFCNRRGLSNVAQADVQKLPFHDQSFDAVTAADVLYHKNVANDQLSLKELHRVLKPDGIIILNLPAFEFLRSSHDRAIHTKRRYTKSQLWSMVTESGFRIRKLYYRNVLLFPLVSLVRILRKGKSTGDSDVVLPSKPFNTALAAMLMMDDWLSRKIPFPAGVSLFCVAQK